MTVQNGRHLHKMLLVLLFQGLCFWRALSLSAILSDVVRVLWIRRLLWNRGGRGLFSVCSGARELDYRERWRCNACLRQWRHVQRTTGKREEAWIWRTYTCWWNDVRQGEFMYESTPSDWSFPLPPPPPLGVGNVNGAPKHHRRTLLDLTHTYLSGEKKCIHMNVYVCWKVMYNIASNRRSRVTRHELVFLVTWGFMTHYSKYVLLRACVRALAMSVFCIFCLKLLSNLHLIF